MSIKQIIQAVHQVDVIAHLHVTGAIHLRYICSVRELHITGSEGQVSGGFGKGGAIVKIVNFPKYSSLFAFYIGI